MPTLLLSHLWWCCNEVGRSVLFFTFLQSFSLPFCGTEMGLCKSLLRNFCIRIQSNLGCPRVPTLTPPRQLSGTHRVCLCYLTQGPQLSFLTIWVCFKETVGIFLDQQFSVVFNNSLVWPEFFLDVHVCIGWPSHTHRVMQTHMQAFFKEKFRSSLCLWVPLTSFADHCGLRFCGLWPCPRTVYQSSAMQLCFCPLSLCKAHSAQYFNEHDFAWVGSH